MKYNPIITQSDGRGLHRSLKQGLKILADGKFKVHNILVYKSRKVALCDEEDNILHIITRKTYQTYITPELKFV